MRTILCYGDSNTFGWSADGYRLEYHERWTGILQKQLGDSFRVIEEGLGGRTTRRDDIDAPGRNGLEYIIPCVQSHQPIDLVVLMLGTNDMKRVYQASAENIANGIGEIVHALCNPLSWDSRKKPEILVISPPQIHEDVVLNPGADALFGSDSIKLSQELPDKLKTVLSYFDAHFCNATEVVTASEKDGIHLDAGLHKIFAGLVLQEVMKIFP